MFVFPELCTSQSLTEQMLRKNRKSQGQWQLAERVLMGAPPCQDREDGGGDCQVEKEGSGSHQTQHGKTR